MTKKRKLWEQALAIIDDNLGILDTEEGIITNRFATASRIVEFVQEQVKKTTITVNSVTLCDKFAMSALTEQKIFICECRSFTHQAIFWWDREDKQLYVTIHLTTHRNFFKRLWQGLKYAFGFTSNYGEWDEFLFKPEDEKELRDYLEHKCK